MWRLFEHALKAKDELHRRPMAALLRFHPALDPFRALPRFQTLVKVADDILGPATKGDPPAQR